jgi:hypothetical protein
MTAYGKGFGWRPGASGRSGIEPVGRRPKASEERTRGTGKASLHITDREGFEIEP